MLKSSQKIFIKNIFNDFLNNDLIDEENKKEFLEKLKNNLNNQIDIFDKENEVIFKDNFESSLNDLSKNFLNNLSEKENKKNFNFFFEFDKSLFS